MKIDGLEQLMVEELKDLYSAEQQITEALPKMVDEAQTSELRQAFEHHLKQTKGHVQRLEDVFDELNVSDRQKKCKGMEALIQEGEEMMKQAADANTRDAALISAAQRVEHYEMAGYGTVISYAQKLDHNTVAEHLQQTLNEEKQTDLALSLIAESHVNADAM